MLYYQFAFISFLVGGAVGALLTRKNRWFFLQRTPAACASAQFLKVLAWTCLPHAALLLAAIALGQAPAPSAPRLLPLAASALHVSALSFLVLRSPLPTRLLPLALVALAWWIPALLPGLSGLLSAAPALASVEGAPDTWGSLAPVGALILVALLLPRSGGTTQ